ncbi:hypothetical protein GCM10010912_55860 [Paenibacillus albidus]|uniref:Uncharacterized protein n=1 Tax=Paenibacillus albidus TaxID=2041023 RepID=A0A917FTM0_9BACL|nr:hypothetical protein GCM10010912_55860 [Paenibacillus albidus]
MLKTIFKNYPLWFMLIWCAVMIGFVVIFITGINLALMMGGLLILYVSNAIRAWKSERILSVISIVLSCVFAVATFLLL